MKGVNKACRYYLIRDKDFIVNIFVSLAISLFFVFLSSTNAFDTRGDSYIILILYLFIAGLSFIISNSMIVNLTVKDRLCHRIDFLLASGIDIKDLIKIYAKEMWKLSSIVPFLLFVSLYITYDFKANFLWIVLLFVSTMVMTYFEVLFMNILSLFQKNFKFFKNIIFFGTTILIYMIGIFSKEILYVIEKHNFNIIYIILGMNIILILFFSLLSLKELKKMNYESVVNREGS